MLLHFWISISNIRKVNGALIITLYMPVHKSNRNSGYYTGVSVATITWIWKTGKERPKKISEHSGRDSKNMYFYQQECKVGVCMQQWTKFQYNSCNRVAHYRVHWTVTFSQVNHMYSVNTYNWKGFIQFNKAFSTLKECVQPTDCTPNFWMSYYSAWDDNTDSYIMSTNHTVILE